MYDGTENTIHSEGFIRGDPKHRTFWDEYKDFFEGMEERRLKAKDKVSFERVVNKKVLFRKRCKDIVKITGKFHLETNLQTAYLRPPRLAS